MEICKKELCSGCSACASVCPFGAVSMISDEEGFSRPAIDTDKCVECGLCQKKCPVNENEAVPAREVYAAYSKNDDIRKSSSSGGIFADLALAVISEGGVVCGAGYGEKMKVRHKFAENGEELQELMGSKYVQSDMHGIFERLGEYLENGKTVLFSGTPCQCSAVKNVFGKYDGLILLDFICHGVPTPKLFEKFIGESFERVENVSFRDKKRGWDEFSMRVDSKNGEYNVSMYKDPYLRMFLENIALRPSCYECSWKGDHFVSDITLADFWGVSKVLPHMNDNKGTSLVVLRSEKGKALFEKIKADIKMCKTDLSRSVSSNVMYYRSTPKPARREAFFEKLNTGCSFKELSKDFGKSLSNAEIVKIRLKIKAKVLLGKLYRLKNK